jgi:hypothetical protein
MNGSYSFREHITPITKAPVLSPEREGLAWWTTSNEINLVPNSGIIELPHIHLMNRPPTHGLHPSTLVCADRLAGVPVPFHYGVMMEAGFCDSHGETTRAREKLHRFHEPSKN